MKTLLKSLPSAPTTREDRAIWLRFNLPLKKPRPKLAVSPAYHEADRRDAELMLEAQQIANFGDAAIELYGIAFRGWTEGGRYQDHDHMKPLPSAPLTPEDYRIWDVLSDPPPGDWHEPVSLHLYQSADRRDAALILEAQRVRRMPGSMSLWLLDGQIYGLFVACDPRMSELGEPAGGCNITTCA
jgi:hypothetical protein